MVNKTYHIENNTNDLIINLKIVCYQNDDQIHYYQNGN
jgi:hypothetical protein